MILYIANVFQRNCSTLNTEGNIFYAFARLMQTKAFYVFISFSTTIRREQINKSTIINCCAYYGEFIKKGLLLQLLLLFALTKEHKSRANLIVTLREH